MHSTLQVTGHCLAERPRLHGLQTRDYGAKACAAHTTPRTTVKVTSQWPLMSSTKCHIQHNRIGGHCARYHKGVSGFKCAKCDVFLWLNSGKNKSSRPPSENQMPLATGATKVEESDVQFSAPPAQKKPWKMTDDVSASHRGRVSSQQ